MRSAGRKTRTRAHVRADIAIKYVEWICARAGFTTSATPAGADYGIDLLLQTFDGKGRVEAGEVKLQVKAVSRPRFVEGGERIACLVDKRDLELWLDHLFPVILVLYHPATATAYWVY